MKIRLFRLSFNNLRSLAFELGERNRLKHPFNMNKKLAGKDWVYGFFKRNSSFSLSQPENASAARAAAFNKPNVANFFKLSSDLIEKYKFAPNKFTTLMRPASQLFQTSLPKCFR